MKSPFCQVGIWLLALSACSGGGGDSVPGEVATVQPGDPRITLIQVADVTGLPIPGAVVSVTLEGGASREQTTDADGNVEFRDLPAGDNPVSVDADGFEPYVGSIWAGGGATGLHLEAEGAWSVGRALVLDTVVVDRAGDGSRLTFSVDVAVIDGEGEANSTLTAADFSVGVYDCGWFGPRGCASDASGNATNQVGSYRVEGGAQAFALHPSATRHPYVVGVLVEQSTQMDYWEHQRPALESFFTMLGGNDVGSLMAVQTENGQSTLAALGPFTSDGTIYLDAIDRLASAGDPPELPPILVEAIERTAAVEGFGLAGTERHLLVMASPQLTVAEIDAVTAIALSRGVSVSTVNTWNWGLPEIAVRTGGFVAQFDDPRQLGMVFAAMDQLLAGTLPYYRMQFLLTAVPHTFVAGGNVKIFLTIRVPSPIPHRGVFIDFDVAIP